MEGAGSCAEGRHRRGPGAGPQGVPELHEAAAAGTTKFHFVRILQDRLPGPQQMAQTAAKYNKPAKP